MEALPKVILIRQLIQIILCLKGSKAVKAEKVHGIHQRLAAEKMQLSRAAPVTFARLHSAACFSADVSVETLHSFVWFGARCPSSDWLLRAVGSAHTFSFSLKVFQFMCRGEVKGIGYQSCFEVLLGLGFFLCSTCAMLLSVSLNCAFLLITSLTRSFSSSRSLFALSL